MAEGLEGFLLDNLNAAVQAPLAFIVTLGVGSVAGYYAGRWKFSTLVDHARAATTAVEAQLQFRIDQGEAYREKSDRYDSLQRSAAVEPSGDLKARTLETVAEIREFISLSRDNVSRLTLQGHTGGRGQDEAQRNLAWEQMVQATLNESTRMSSEWDRRFRVKARLLRDELASRLGLDPLTGAQSPAFEHPANSFDHQDVADSLESMALRLRG